MDLDTYFRFLIALVFVLALIGLLAWLARRYGAGGAAIARGSGKARRLGIVEVTALDAKHRLVLVRRDDVEHLIVLGAGSELLVESGIPAPGTPAADDGSFSDSLAERQPSPGEEAGA